MGLGCRRLVSALVLLLASPAYATEEASVNLRSEDTIWVVHPIDSGYGARSSIALALHDIKLDWYKVMGAPPAVVVTEKVGFEAIPPAFQGTALFFGRSAALAFLPPASRHPEAHCISLKQANSDNITLIGMVGHLDQARGQVFAAYSFSERILHVQPLWFWIDREPNYLGNISLRTSQVVYDYGEPKFHWRGIFTNDEDLLGGFRPDPLGQSVFSAETWNRVCEALLRLKGNLLIPGTVAFPDESSYEVARRRGVAVTQQHFTLLGSNTWRWPVGIPYSFDQNPKVQEFVWKGCVDAYEGREAVWTIGYRGLNDYPFWKDEPSFNTTAKRCELISAAMAKQADIVRRTPGRAHDPCVTYLWSEMLDLFLSGDLKIPENTTTVFADEGGSGTFDPRIYDNLGPGNGAYYHVQMESPGKMAQLTEMVPPAVFFQEMEKFVRKQATSYFMLNLSDLKPCAFLVDTILRYLWNPDEAIEAGPAMAEANAISSWCQRVFGGTYAIKASAVVTAYFNVDYIKGESTGRRYGDEHLSGLVRKLLSGAESPQDVLQFVARPLVQLRELFAQSTALFQEMLEQDVEAAQRFESSFLLYVAVHYHGCVAAEKTAMGLSTEDALHFEDALSAIAAVQLALRKSEQLKWRGLYASDHLVDFSNVACLLRQHMRLTGKGGDPIPQCNMPDGQPWHSGTGAWSEQFVYANISTNYPYLNPPRSDTNNMNWMVRVSCAEGATNCKNTPIGGRFNGTVYVQMYIVANDQKENDSIRYTLDGTTPTSESALYKGPLKISSTVQISAKAFGAGPNRLVTRPKFVREDE